MTLHLLMMTATRDGFVWVTDRMAGTGQGGSGTVEKITHVRGLNVALSIWGNFKAMDLHDWILNRMRSHSFPVASDSSAVRMYLTECGILFKESGQDETDNPSGPRGAVLVLISQKPEIYTLSINNAPPVALAVFGQAPFGDTNNPALFFSSYYYERCGKTISELVLLGIHTMRMAERLNTKGIQGLDVWICENGDMRQLRESELEPFTARSEALDSAILRDFQNPPALSFDSIPL